MAKTYRKKNMGSTRKNRGTNSGLKGFQKEVTVVFLEMLLLVKLFHWKTHSYATHKATDELYESLNGHIDSFIEILMGKSGSRIDLMNQKTIKLQDLQSTEKLKSKVNNFKSYLVGFENKQALKTMSNTDLFNVRDEILGDMNKFLYLLTLQ
jgi:hypothetical protein